MVKTNNWQSDFLKQLSIKQYGRSYDDKYNNAVKAMGGNADDARGFRNFLDTMNLQKSKRVYKPKQGSTLEQWDKESDQEAAARKAKADKERKQREEQQKKQKAAQQKSQAMSRFNLSMNKSNGLFDDIKAAGKAAYHGFNPFDNVSMDDAVKGYLNRKTSKAFDEIARGANRTVDSASFGIMSNLDKKVNNRDPYYLSNRKFGEGGGTDMLTTGLGYLLPGTGLYKGLNATKAGMSLTNFGSKGIAQRLLSEAAKGGLIGAAQSGTEVGVKELLNPKDQNWKDNAKYIGTNTAIGAIADPLIYGAGKGIAKGFETASSKSMKNMLPDEKSIEKAFQNIAKTEKANNSLPIKQVDLPKWNDTILPELKPKAKIQVETPKVGKTIDELIPANERELNDSIQQQYEYLKSSMGKGVDSGTTSNGLDGNFKQVTGTYSVSNNPKWYQDFYAKYGRKPNDKELWQLAEQQVKNGFEDEMGKIPAWQPENIQELDREIEQVTQMIKQDPAQEEVLGLYLEGLKMDREIALKEAGLDPKKQYQYMKTNQSGKVPDGIQAMQSEIIPLRSPSGNKQFKEMNGLQTLINKLQGGKYGKTITHQELLNSARKNLGVTIRHGRLGNVPDEVSGYFKVNPEVIRTRNYGDIGVISHEIGHSLDKQYKLTSEAFDSELLKLGYKTSGKDYTKQEVREEGLAEFIRLFLTDPQQAVKDAPNFSQQFEKVLPKNVKKGLMKTQADVDRWIEQGPEMRLRGKIDRTGKEIESVSDKVDKMYSQFVDKFDRLKKVEKAITGKVNDATQSLYKKARLSVGSPKKAELVLHDFKDILKPIEKYGYSMKDVGDYATAMHAKELESLGIESGMSKEEVEKVIAKFDTPEMQQIHKGLIKYNNKLLNMLQEGQVLSKEAVNAMKEKYHNYVPFYRFFEDDITVGMSGNKGFTNLTNPVKRLKGSTRDVIDPLESMVKNTFAVVNAVEKNKVGLELARLADIEGAGRFVERLHGAQQVKKEHIVTVFQNGEKVQYQLDKDLYESIQQLDEDTTNKVIQFLSMPTSTLRAGATLTPEFMLRNPIRDQFQSYVVSNYGYKPIIDLPIGAWKVLMGKAFNKEGVYKQWIENGGGYGNYLSQDRNYLRETLNELHKEGTKFQRGFKTVVSPKEWLKILQTMSEFTEEATKVGEFRRALKKGASPQEAAYQARDLMDFGRVGSDMRQWNRAVAFLNANIQGKDRIARAFKNNPVRTTLKAITGVTIPAIGAYVAMDKYANEKQKETYANTPKWMKDTFFILPIPGTDELARIPKPFDLAPVFANPVEEIMNHIKDNDPDSWSDFIKRQATDMLKIPYMLTGLTPIIENITNHSFFTGGPIVPRRDQDLLPQDQYGPSTSLTARTVGKLTGEGGKLSFIPDVSPYKVDNFIRGYGAGLGKYTTSGLDKLLEKLNVGKMPPQEAKKWSELPVMNAFTVDTTGGGQVMTDFYDALDKLTKERNSAKRNQEGYKEGDDVKYARVDDYKYLNKVSREISDLRNQYRATQSSYELTPQEKRKQLDELDRQMNSLAREALIKIGEKAK